MGEGEELRGARRGPWRGSCEGTWVSARAAPLTRPWRSASFDKEGQPSCRIVVQTVVWCTLTEDTERPLSQDRKTKKFAKSHAEGLWRTKWSAHHLTQPSQYVDYTPCVPKRWAYSTKQSSEEEAPSEDSRVPHRSQAWRCSTLGFCVEWLTWAAEGTEVPVEA